MVKRQKRLEKSVVSLKKQIENHFDKLECDIKENDAIFAGYHIKEIEKNLIDELEYKINLLGNVDKGLLDGYRKRFLRKLLKRGEMKM